MSVIQDVVSWDFGQVGHFSADLVGSRSRGAGQTFSADLAGSISRGAEQTFSADLAGTE